MKTTKVLSLFRSSLTFALAAISHADQTIPGNLTIQQGLLIQGDTNLWGANTRFGHLAENGLLPGFRLSFSQEETTVTQTNVITPGYMGFQNVVVEDYGSVDNSYMQPIFGTVTVYDLLPAIYDSDGNLVSEAYTSMHEEWQQTGGNWISSIYWGVIGTHTEQQAVWVPDVVENVSVSNYGAPHVMFNASRSDTNYDFVFPSESGSGAMWTALSIYSGGLAMTSEDSSRRFALTPWSFQQFGSAIDGAGFTGLYKAEESLHTSSLAWADDSGGTSSVVTASHLRADALQLLYTESGPGGATTVTQTQIAPRSAQFGGAVTVEGNLNAKGTLRVMPAGDLDMGVFHKGTKPDGTIDNGGY